MFRASGLTAVAVASANNYTAVFLGTATGRLLKVSVLHGSSPGRPTEGQSPSAFFSFPSGPPQWPVTEGGTGLSDVCTLSAFWHLLAWGLPLLDLCSAHAPPWASVSLLAAVVEGQQRCWPPLQGSSFWINHEAYPLASFRAKGGQGAASPTLEQTGHPCPPPLHLSVGRSALQPGPV